MKNSLLFLLPIIGALALIFIPALAEANSGDFSGGVSVGTSYAGVIAAPTNGLIVQGTVGIGTNNPTSTLQVAGTITATTVTSNLTYGGGFVNKMRNGQMAVAQRGTSGTVTTATDLYTLDGWIIHATGASVTWSQSAGVTVQTSSQKTVKALTITGATSNTDAQIYQRIESYDAAAFSSQQITVQFTYTNNTGASNTPQLSTCYASAADNFATCTSDLSAVNMQACSSGSTCTEAYSFAASSNASNGYQVKIDFGALSTTGKNVVVSALDARVTPGIATGTISNPPWPELVPLGIEFPRDARYYEYGDGNNWLIFSGNVTSGSLYYTAIPFKTTMRVVPTMAYTYDASSAAFPSTAPTTNLTGINDFAVFPDSNQHG